LASSQNLVAKPVQRWMIRDPLVRGSAYSESEANPRVGIPIPSTANVGGLIPTISGDPSGDTDETVSLRLVNAGAVGRSQWTWAGDDGIYRGYACPLTMWAHHSPTSTNSQAAAIAYSRVYRRVVVATLTAADDVKIVYSELNNRPQSASDWTLAPGFTPTGGRYGSNHELAMCELRDGTLLLACRREDGDFDLYRSQDGGDSWARSAVSILRKQIESFGDATTKTEAGEAALGDNYTPRMAASGDWVRLVLGKFNGSLLTYASSDSGATWAWVDELEAPTDIEDDLSAVQDNDVQPFAIAAVDDATGAFVLVGNPPAAGTGNRVGVWYATRNDAWALQSGLLSNPTIDTTPRSYAAWTDPVYLWIAVYDANPSTTTDGWHFFRVQRTAILDSDAWQGEGAIDPTGGLSPLREWAATKLTPIQLNAVWCDDRAAFCGYLQDKQESSPVTRKASRPWLCWVGGWSMRPWGNDPTIAFGTAEALHWTARQGEPANGSTSSTVSQWTGTVSDGATHSWNSAVYVDTSIVSETQSGIASFKYIFDDGLDPTAWNTADTTWSSEFVVAVGNTFTSMNTAAAVQWRSLASGTTNAGWLTTMRVGATQVVIYQGFGPTGTTLASITGIDPTTADDLRFHRFRFYVVAGVTPSTPTGVIQYRDDAGDAWRSSATFDLGYASTTPGVTEDSLDFGLVVSGATSGAYARWREVRVGYQRNLVNYVDFN
jgi:hypothetical protein